MTEHAQAYQEARRRISVLVRDLDDERLDAVAPATPEWRVRDVVAHLTGVSADIIAGNLDGIASDDWTAKQVDDRRDRPVRDLLDEWEKHGSAVEELIPAFPPGASAQLLADTATHEQDIRAALGEPGGRDADALAIGFAWMASLGGTPMRFETDAGTFPFGEGEPRATVHASRFELFRAMTGRRSLEQMRAYGWEGEPDPEALPMLIFKPRPSSLVE